MAFCTPNTKAGKPCTAQAMQEVIYCYRHYSDKLETDMIQARIEDGKPKAVAGYAVVQNLGVLLKVYGLATADSRVFKLEQQASIDSSYELIHMGAN